MSSTIGPWHQIIESKQYLWEYPVMFEVGTPLVKDFIRYNSFLALDVLLGGIKLLVGAFSLPFYGNSI